MTLTLTKKYIKCHICKTLHHKRFNECEMHKFKSSESLLCTYGTTWSIYKWLVRIGVPPLILFCIYNMLREVGRYCNEVNIWRIIFLVLGVVVVILGCLILAIVLLLVGVELHERFRLKGGSYFGGER